MTAAEFVDYWPLWTYLFGCLSSMVGFFARGAYFGSDVYDPDFFMPRFFGSLIWPIIWTGIGGVALGNYVKKREKLAYAKEVEQKKIEARNERLLKEAGF